MAEKACYKKPKFILATDLDGTLVGNKLALAKFNRYISENNDKFLLIYVTGRTFSSTWQLIAEEKLLYPDVLVTDVGTEIYTSPYYKVDKLWEKKMASSWNAENTKKVIESIEGLVPQKINPRFRLACYISENNSENTVSNLEKAVRKANLPVKLIISSKNLVDIVPKCAGKGSSLRYIQNLYSISKECVFVCGDSGNDLSMFLEGFKGIVVGNALPELKDALNLRRDNIYFSKSCYASGILEGLKKYGL